MTTFFWIRTANLNLKQSSPHLAHARSSLRKEYQRATLAKEKGFELKHSSVSSSERKPVYFGESMRASLRPVYQVKLAPFDLNRSTESVVCAKQAQGGLFLECRRDEWNVVFERFIFAPISLPQFQPDSTPQTRFADSPMAKLTGPSRNGYHSHRASHSLTGFAGSRRLNHSH